MNNKKIWTPNMSTADIFEFANNCLLRCETKKLLLCNKISAFQVYQVNRDWPTFGYQELSTFFKFSKNDHLEKNRAREIVLRLLSAILKAQIHFNQDSIIRSEPYIFTIPDLYKTGQFNYGIFLHVEKNNKVYTLLTAEWDLSFSGDNVVKINPWEKYTSLVDHNSENLFNLPHILKIKAMDQFQYFSIKDWKSRSDYKNKVKAISNTESFSFGKLLPNEYNSQANKLYSSISYIEWADGIKRWFLPKGSDFALTSKYIDQCLSEG